MAIPDSHVLPETEADFFAAIIRHAELEGKHSLYTGQGYEQLAEFLKSSPSRSPSSTSGESPDGEEPFAVLHNLSRNDGDGVATFGASTGHLDFVHWNIDGPAHILFLRGAPSRDWLGILATKLSISPDFLRRHMTFDFDDKKGQRHIDHHALPSSSQTVLELPVFTVLRRLHEQPQNSEHLETHRSEVEAAMQSYHRHLPSLVGPGHSVVRGYTAVSGCESILEQRMTITLCRSCDGWILVVWQDHGRDLGASVAGPWTPKPEVASFLEATPVPMRHDYLPYHDVAESRLSSSAGSRRWQASQNACHLPFDYGKFLDSAEMKRDPFHAMADCIKLSLSSGNQYLNVLSSQIDREGSSKSDSLYALTNLRFLKGRIARYCVQLRETLIVLGFAQDWPTARAVEIPGGRDQRSHALIDVDHLLTRASLLTDSCEKAMADLVSQSVYEVSSVGLKNAVRLERLTVLATIFIPLSFTATLCGMNFKEVGTGRLSIWLFPLLLAGVFAIASLLYFADLQRLAAAELRRRTPQRR